MTRFVRQVLVVLLALTLAEPAVTRADGGDPVRDAALAQAVSEVLRQSAAVPDRVHLLGAGVSDGAITLDLSHQILDYGTGAEMEAALREILFAASAAAGLADAEVEFRLLVEGEPLDRVLSRTEPREVAARGFEVAPHVQAGLRGARIVVSPGHGWLWNATARRWELQRPFTLNVQEDFVNGEIAMNVHGLLLAAGAESRGARNLSSTAGTGESGKPRWEEAALYHVKSLGAPSSIWNSAASAYDADIRTRPLFANWIAAAALVSLHNNAGGGTGTEIWIDTGNGYRSESERLARAIQRRLVGRIRTDYDSNWNDRGLKQCNGCLGENRLATRPAVIVELAFMDRPSPDNAALRNAAFRQVAALGIREGLEEFFGAASPAPTPTPTPRPTPTPTPRATPSPTPLAAPQLWIDGSTSSSSRSQGRTFEFEARSLTPGRLVTRWLRQPNGQVVEMQPRLSADGSGRVSWRFTPTCSTPTGSYDVWVVDTARNWSSNRVRENVLPGCR